MLADVVLIDLGKAVDRIGNDTQLFRRDRHGGQRARPNTFGCEHSAYPGDLSFAPQLLQHAQHNIFRDAQFARQFGKRSRTQRKILLPFIQ